MDGSNPNPICADEDGPRHKTLRPTRARRQKWSRPSSYLHVARRPASQTPSPADDKLSGSDFGHRCNWGSLSGHRRNEGSPSGHLKAENGFRWTKHEPSLNGWTGHEPDLRGRIESEPSLNGRTRSEPWMRRWTRPEPRPTGCAQHGRRHANRQDPRRANRRKQTGSIPAPSQRRPKPKPSLRKPAQPAPSSRKQTQPESVLRD